MRARRHRRRALLLAICALAATGLALLASGTHLLRRPELATVDARFDIRGSEPTPKDVVVVGVDATTIAHFHTPILRRRQARVIDALRRAGARVIAMDFEFASPTTQKDDDALFAALRRARGTVVATSIVQHGRSPVLGGPALQRSVGAVPGVTNFGARSARYGVVRRLPAGEGGLPSFAVAIAQQATGKNVDRSRLSGDGAWIDFAGPPGSVPYVSYISILDGSRGALAKVRGKIVIVGETDPILKDVQATSAGAGMPGPEINANAVETILRNFPLKDPPGWLALLAIVLAGTLVPLTALRFAGLRWTPAVPGVAVLYAAVAQLAFAGGIVLPVMAPALALVLSAAGTLGVSYATDLRDRRHLRLAFARFVPPEVVEEVAATAGEDLRLGGVRREGTVLFSDLRGFTTVSEGLEPEAVITLLNRYLTEMSDAILDHGGTVVAYMGDGIMAVFGAPLAQPDHADRAVAAAREMLGPRLQAFNASSPGAAHMRMGIGICSGPVMSGTVGSQRRLEYAAVGDATNTASRLESMTKEAGCPILIAESTRAALRRPDAIGLRMLGELEVRGRVERVKAWTFDSF